MTIFTNENAFDLWRAIDQGLPMPKEAVDNLRKQARLHERDLDIAVNYKPGTSNKDLREKWGVSASELIRIAKRNGRRTAWDISGSSGPRSANAPAANTTDIWDAR